MNARLTDSSARYVEAQSGDCIYFMSQFIIAICK